MRLVTRPSEFDAALASAQREARSSFGNDALLVERYLSSTRHVEVQIFADRFGNGLYLGDRDCSIQRRYQKVVEEAPAPGIPETIRQTMGATAVRAALALDYLGAGTLEFLYEPSGVFYFMEMNTRLQVEHPVTELVTGQDLVEWQLRVAAGEPLPCSQEQIKVDGHAIELRLYAEDPANDFLPSSGRLSFLRTPEESRHLRLDTGVMEGDEISIHYDPLIAKLIAWDENRELAITRLTHSISRYLVGGITTNIGFLRNLMTTTAFKRFEVDTCFIDTHLQELLRPPEFDKTHCIVLAACYLTLDRKRSTNSITPTKEDPTSPFNRLDHWRLNAHYSHPFELIHDSRHYPVSVRDLSGHLEIRVGSSSFKVEAELRQERMTATLNGHRISLDVHQEQGKLSLYLDGQRFICHRSVDSFEALSQEPQGSLTAPMSGTVIALFTEPGSRVKAGDGLMVIEAMKMEHTLAAPGNGVVKSLHFQTGDLVNEGDELLALEMDTPPALNEVPDESA
jgi:3-methylcrotonyl-CoA carboxylase alpha subunit